MTPWRATPGATNSPGSLGYSVLKDELDVVGSTEIEVLADLFLEENSAMHWWIQDLGDGELDLGHGNVVTIAGRLLLHRERTRETALPLPEEFVDSLRSQAVGQLLHPSWVIALQDPVGQFLVANAFLGELSFEVFMAVEAQLGAVREVGAVLGTIGRSPCRRRRSSTD